MYGDVFSYSLGYGVATACVKEVGYNDCGTNLSVQERRIWYLVNLQTQIFVSYFVRGLLRIHCQQKPARLLRHVHDIACTSARFAVFVCV